MPEEHFVLARDVSVREGFRPHFAQTFRVHYGKDSAFVGSVSDYFTTALARLLKAHDMLARETHVALYAPPQALESLSDLMRRLMDVYGRKEAGLTLWHEACGVKPIGSLSEMVDAGDRRGTFDAWLSAIENGQYEEASQIIRSITSNSEESTADRVP